MNHRLAIRDMHKNDQPRYRAQSVGLQALSTAELLQLITSFSYLDTANEVLAKAGSLKRLSQMPPEEIAEIPGVGPATATAIQAALELGRRRSLEDGEVGLAIRTPADVVHILITELRDKEQEHMVALLINNQGRLISIETVYVGSLDTCMIRTGELFRAAVRRNAVAVIVAHNHPSGDPTPSSEDIEITKQIIAAGQILDIQVLDHIVVGHNTFASMRNRGLGFDQKGVENE